MVMLKTAQRIGLASAIALLASLSALAQTSNWNIDPAHSTAQFTVRHLGISNVTGNFTKVTGSVVLNEKDSTQSQVSASIDANSVDTRIRRVAAVLNLREQVAADDIETLRLSGTRFEFTDRKAESLMQEWIKDAASLETELDEARLQFPDPDIFAG